eukprot:snap_masked-scaffold_26-processed-gene-4.125-mRNA-1 protein AED:1.00 eAED:1.00 QI:0/0/0/0/1/1/3/0/64
MDTHYIMKRIINKQKVTMRVMYSLSTLSLELIHYTEASNTLFNGFSAIKYHYEKDSETARLAAK